MTPYHYPLLLKQLLVSPIAQRSRKEIVTSAGQVGISGADLRRLPLPLAPLNEQKRIADKLDAVLAGVDACRDRLDRIPAILKRFYQSVLAAATSGKLTEEWRADSLQQTDASDLVAQLNRAHVDAGGYPRGNASDPTDEAHDMDAALLPKGWRVAELKTICEPGRPITYGILKPGPELEAGVPYVRVADFPGNRLNLDGIKRTSPKIDDQFRRSRLRPNDLLLSIRGSVGRLVKIPETLDQANITQDTARLSISPLMCTDFAHLCLQSPDVQRRMKRATRGVAVRGINIGDVRALQIPIPCRAEQTEIVRRVESLFTLADRLEARYATARAQTDRLAPALLAKAFRGELVPQDPNDEPASELLARIAAERVSAANAPAAHKSASRRPARADRRISSNAP